VKYELGFCIPEDAIFHSHRRENLKSYSLGALTPCSVLTRLEPELPSIVGSEVAILGGFRALGPFSRSLSWVLNSCFLDGKAVKAPSSAKDDGAVYSTPTSSNYGKALH
jgi:hypothetical protein